MPRIKHPLSIVTKMNPAVEEERAEMSTEEADEDELMDEDLVAEGSDAEEDQTVDGEEENQQTDSAEESEGRPDDEDQGTDDVEASSVDMNLPPKLVIDSDLPAALGISVINSCF